MKLLKTACMLNLYMAKLNIHDNTNVTSDSGMSDQMKTYYSDYLIDYAKPLLIHDQFGQKHPIPKGGGREIEFRKKSPFAKALTPLTEGVTPAGQKLEWTVLKATVNQYGAYVELSDRLITEAIDNNVVYATENCGDQSGRTLDTITREVLNGGTNVQYGDAVVTSRDQLVGGDPVAANNHYLTVNAVKRAVRTLKVGGAKPINGSYVAIIHPDVSYDLTNDKAWIDVKQYTDPSDIYEGEIGKLYGCRFVETLEAKIFAGAGAAGRDVYSTLFFGADAYGITEIEGEGLKHFVKQLGSAGTSDPIDQRATVGWKASKVAERLVESYMLRVETASTYQSGAN